MPLPRRRLTAAALLLLAGPLLHAASAAPVVPASHPWVVRALAPDSSTIVTVTHPTLIKDDALGQLYPVVTTVRPATYTGYVLQRLSDGRPLAGFVHAVSDEVAGRRLPLWWMVAGPGRAVLEPGVRYVLTYLSDQPGTMVIDTHDTAVRRFTTRAAFVRVSYQPFTIPPGPLLAAVRTIGVGPRTLALIAVTYDAVSPDDAATYAHQCIETAETSCELHGGDTGNIDLAYGPPGSPSWLGSACEYWPGWFPRAETAVARVSWATTGAPLQAGAYLLTVDLPA